MKHSSQIEPEAPMDRCEGTPPVGVKWHPYADLFPWMDGAAREELKADIAAHGVMEPIVFLDGAILDGCNRYDIARELGIDYPRVEYVGDDPLGFVLSKNLSRRHLTDRQRADVAARLASLPRGANQHSSSAPDMHSEHPSIEGPSLAAAAKIMDVSVAAVERSKTIQEHAAPELKAAYEAGEVSQSAAAEVARLSKEKQAKVVADGTAKKAAKEQREKRSAARTAEQTKNDARRDAAQAALPPAVQAKAAAVAALKVKPADDDAIQVELEELHDAVAALETEVETLRAENKIYDEMRVQFESGGFESVIAGKDEQIRVLRGQVETESRDKAAWKRSADYWKDEALKLGWTNRVVIDLNG